MNEVISKRTLDSKTYDMGQGKFQVTQYTYPIHFKDQDGNWQDINIDINPISAWEFKFASTENAFKTYFYDYTNPNNHLVSIEANTDDGRELWINFKLDGATPTSTQTTSDTFTFVDCFPNVDVQYLINNETLKENIILKEKTDLRNFLFTLKLGNVKVSEIDGEIVFQDELNDDVIFKLNAPFMIDANGTFSDNVSYHITEKDGFQAINVVINDEEYLENAIYPVTIDPPISYLSNETRVYTNYPGAAWNSAELGINGIYNGGGQGGGLYFNFLEKLKSSNFIINKMTYSIYTTRVTSANTAYVYRITNNWNNPTAPAVGAQYTTFYTTAGVWNTIDVKSIFASNFYGLWIAGIYGGATVRAYFASPYYGDLTKRPILTVEYLEKPIMGFLDDAGAYYGDSKGTVFKKFNVGSLIAGQTSLPVKINVQNLSGYTVSGLQVYILNQNIAPGVKVEISKTLNPFVPEDRVYVNGTFNDKDKSFVYVRLVTEETATYCPDFQIMAKAYPV